jgi:sugar phosphate permease
MYDVGTIFGSLLLGYITDYTYSRRTPTIVIALFLGIFVTFSLTLVDASTHHLTYGFIFLWVGFFIGGVACLITGAASADFVINIIYK